MMPPATKPKKQRSNRVTGHSGRIEVQRGLEAVAAAAFAWNRAWESACKHDGVDPAADRFIVFSDGNPFVQFLEPATREWQARRMEYAAGGYVGLQMGGTPPTAKPAKSSSAVSDEVVSVAPKIERLT